VLRSYSVMTPFPIGAGLTEVNFGTALCICPKGSCYWARRYSIFSKITLSSNMRYMLMLSWVGCLFLLSPVVHEKISRIWSAHAERVCVWWVVPLLCYKSSVVSRHLSPVCALAYTRTTYIMMEEEEGGGVCPQGQTHTCTCAFAYKRADGRGNK
jgi:hypothetical protein